MSLDVVTLISTMRDSIFIQSRFSQSLCVTGLLVVLVNQIIACRRLGLKSLPIQPSRLARYMIGHDWLYTGQSAP
jgi:hypothetical protein